jgi:predicted RNase H-like HicB family nuclease
VASMKFATTLDRDEDGIWNAECPSIPGCVSQGGTRDEALANIREAIAACLEVRAEQGLPLWSEPESKRLKKKKISFLLAGWLVVLVGGSALYWWLQYGSWRLHGNTLMEHDEVRFGDIPMFFFSVCYSFLSACFVNHFIFGFSKGNEYTAQPQLRGI